MTLRHLTIFICVCDEKSMTKAAGKMHMTQPSVSQAIREMEMHYQAQLFERLGRRLFITAAGEKLLTYARHIVNLNLQTEKAMRRFGSIHQVRLGASVTIGEGLLIDLIKTLYQAHPQYQITSAIHNTAVLEEMLLTDALDIALVEGDIKSEYLLASPFMEDELVFITSPDDTLLRKKSITCEDLEQANFFVREEGSGTRNLFEQVMANHQVDCRTIGVYNNAETIKKAVSVGLGISVISKMAVREELAEGSLCKFAVRDMLFQRKFSMVHHKNKYLSPEIKTLMQFCQQLKESV